MSQLKILFATTLAFTACAASEGPGNRAGAGGSAVSGSSGRGGSTPTGASGSGVGDAGRGASGEAGSSGGGVGSGSSGSSGGNVATAGVGGTGTAGAGGSGVSPAGSAGSGGAAGAGGSTTVPAGEVAILTSRYDNTRTGSNLQEKILTTANVNKTTFGFLFQRSINGHVYGQPLYVPGLMINGAKHNVLYVATESNLVYAFDADDPAATAPLWMKMLEAPVPMPAGYTTCDDMKSSGQVGITSTPVIDLATGKIFVVTKSNDATRLHALDILTGADSATSATLSAPMFDSRLHLNRPGLLLLNGIIYVGVGSHCDKTPYHGWVFAFDSTTMQSKGVYNDTPTGSSGAIWQSGIGLLGDENGIAFCTGNGSVGGMNFSESVVRIKQMGDALAVSEHYTPANSGALNGSDSDLAAGVIRIPGTTFLLSGGKEGPIYVLDQSLAIKQTVTPPSAAGMDGLHSMAVWNGSAGPMVYAWPSGGQLYAYSFANGSLTLKSMVGLKAGHPGGLVTVSSNGTMPNTGVAWATIPRTGDAWHATAQGTLFAYDATDVSKALWNSDDDPADSLEAYAKFSPAIVANGKVYVASFSGKLKVYGLKK